MGVYYLSMESFHSKSEALQYIEFGVERGQYQNCGRLTVIDTLNMIHGRRHHPYCKAHSLGKNDGYRDSGNTYCPPECHFYTSKEEFQLEQKAIERSKWWKTKRQAVGKGVKMAVTGPFIWFQKLPAIVQSLIIILLIVWLFPQFKSTILEILKALKN